LQPAVHMLPALLAIAEQQGLSGMRMLEALVCGYEVAGRLNRGYTPRPLTHPNGQVSLLGAAAAGARLHGLDGADISLSVRIATTMLMTPTYLNTGAGGTTLNLPAGMGGVAGVLAPELAMAGYAARPDAVEEALGQMVGAGFDPSRLARGLGTDWEILEGYFRFYACCNPIHPALDALAEVLEMLRPAPGAIERIDVATYAFAAVMNNPSPPNYFASKYSLPHAAAVLILRGGIGFAEIDDTALADPAIAALRQRVHITEDAAMSAVVPDQKPARVTVTLADGRQASAYLPVSKRDSTPYDPEPLVRSKFRLLAAEVLTPAGIAAAEAAVDAAEGWASPGVLPALLRQHQKAG
jgi:2-methylcitrate dehydratase PrpD